MNPPFGTSLNEGIFIAFMDKAIEISNGPVFLIHKETIDKKLKSLCSKKGYDVEILYRFSYEIVNTKFDNKDMKVWKNKKYGSGKQAKGYHKKDKIDVNLCLYYIYPLLEEAG